MSTKQAASKSTEAVADQVEQPTAADQVCETIFTHRITAVPAAGFWRGDHKWHADGEDINRADFSYEQWEAITAEPLLVVTSL